MAVREVLTYPDPILKSVCSPAQSGPGDREETGRVITDLLDTMEQTSLCALGGGVPLPIKNAIQHFEAELKPYFQS